MYDTDDWMVLAGPFSAVGGETAELVHLDGPLWGLRTPGNDVAPRHGVPLPAAVKQGLAWAAEQRGRQVVARRARIAGTPFDPAARPASLR